MQTLEERALVEWQSVSKPSERLYRETPLASIRRFAPTRPALASVFS